MSLADFGVTDLFQCRVFTREVFIEFKLTGDGGHAVRVALPQFILTAIVVAAVTWVMRHLHWDIDAQTTARSDELDNHRGDSLADGPLRRPSVMPVSVTIIAMSFFVPAGSLLANGWSLGAWRNLSATVLIEQATNSLSFAAVAATLATLQGCLLAMAAERFLRQWRPWIYISAGVPFFVPPTLYAVGVSVLGNQSQSMTWFSASPLPVPMANAAHWLPIALLLIASPLRLADRVTEDSARMEGESDLRAPFRITVWPAALALVAAWFLVFSLTLGDVAISSLLYPPGGQPIAVAIFDAIHYAHEPEVALLCLLLSTLIIIPAMGSVVVLRKIRVI